MPKDDYAIICPYYHKTIGNSIFCNVFPIDGELSTEDCFYKQIFTDRASRNSCYKKYCASFGYKRCNIAKLNGLFYGDVGDLQIKACL